MFLHELGSVILILSMGVFAKLKERKPKIRNIHYYIGGEPYE